MLIQNGFFETFLVREGNLQARTDMLVSFFYFFIKTTWSWWMECSCGSKEIRNKKIPFLLFLWNQQGLLSDFTRLNLHTFTRFLILRCQSQNAKWNGRSKTRIAGLFELFWTYYTIITSSCNGYSNVKRLGRRQNDPSVKRTWKQRMWREKRGDMGILVRSEFPGFQILTRYCSTI